MLYLEWVAVEADLDHAKRSLEKNREEVDPEAESVNEVEIVKIDRDQGIGIEKIVIAIAIDEAAVVIGKKNYFTFPGYKSSPDFHQQFMVLTEKSDRKVEN